MPAPDIQKLRSDALQHNLVLRNHVPPVPQTVQQTSLEDLLDEQNATWKFSGDGTGGASLVTAPNVSSGGAAIKIEDSFMVKSTGKSAKLMDDFFQNAQGNLPFAAPRITVYTQSDLQNNPNLARKMDAALDRMLLTTPQDRQDTIKRHKDELPDVELTGGTAIAVMEFGAGKQMNRMPLKEKAALVRSEAFAQSLGRTMAPSIALGLKDHMGGTTCNPSNLMYDSATGTITMIDYDAGAPMGIKGKPGEYVYGPNVRAGHDIREMREFLEKAMKSPKDFEKALDDITRIPGDSPFSQVFANFTGAATKDSFFGFPERPESNQLTREEKRDFAANLMKGGIEGLKYMQDNEQALVNAVSNSHDVLDDGTKVENFYTAERMQEFRSEMQKLDADSLGNKMDNMLNQRAQARQVEYGQYDALTQKLQKAEASIQRIQTNPTLGDKFKAFFSRKGHEPIDDLRKKCNKLQDKLDEMADVPEKREFHRNMASGQLGKPVTGQVADDQSVSDDTSQSMGQDVDNLGPKQRTLLQSSQDLSDDSSLDMSIDDQDVPTVSQNNGVPLQSPPQVQVQTPLKVPTMPPLPSIPSGKKELPDIGDLRKSPFESSEDVSDDTSVDMSQEPDIDDLRQSPFERPDNVGDDSSLGPKQDEQVKVQKVGETYKTPTKPRLSSPSLGNGESQSQGPKVGDQVKGLGESSSGKSRRNSVGM